MSEAADTSLTQSNSYNQDGMEGDQQDKNWEHNAPTIAPALENGDAVTVYTLTIIIPTGIAAANGATVKTQVFQTRALAEEFAREFLINELSGIGVSLVKILMMYEKFGTRKLDNWLCSKSQNDYDGWQIEMMRKTEQSMYSAQIYLEATEIQAKLDREVTPTREELGLTASMNLDRVREEVATYKRQDVLVLMPPRKERIAPSLNVGGEKSASFTNPDSESSTIPTESDEIEEQLGSASRKRKSDVAITAKSRENSPEFTVQRVDVVKKQEKRARIEPLKTLVPPKYKKSLVTSKPPSFSMNDHRRVSAPSLSQFFLPNSGPSGNNGKISSMPSPKIPKQRSLSESILLHQVQSEGNAMVDGCGEGEQGRGC